MVLTLLTHKLIIRFTSLSTFFNNVSIIGLFDILNYLSRKLQIRNIICSSKILTVCVKIATLTNIFVDAWSSISINLKFHLFYPLRYYFSHPICLSHWAWIQRNMRVNLHHIPSLIHYSVLRAGRKWWYAPLRFIFSLRFMHTI